MSHRSKRQSPALAWIISFYHEAKSSCHDRFESGMRECLQLAIAYEMEFYPADCALLAQGAPQHYGQASYLYASERNYTLACGAERGITNTGFARSYEQWRKRPPFMLADPSHVTRTRVYIGRCIIWEGHRLEVTSFAEDGNSFNACEYDDGSAAYAAGLPYRRKILRRVRIRHADLAAIKPIAKPAAEAAG